MRRLRELTEAECYARCYGGADENVRVVEAEPRRHRYSGHLTGEELRRCSSSSWTRASPKLRSA